MKRIIAVLSLVTLFILGECTNHTEKVPSVARFVSIINSKIEQMEQQLREADAVYPFLLSSEKKLVDGLSRYENLMENLMAWLFQTSSDYKGRKYAYMREIYDFDVSSVNALCHLWGGYLAEIADGEEHNFIKAFLVKATHDDTELSILISGSDEETEELWRYFRTGERINYLKWVDEGPKAADCLALLPEKDFMMQSVDCTGTSLRLGFLCEMEE